VTKLSTLTLRGEIVCVIVVHVSVCVCVHAM
jgi:hypothetical protein